MMRRFMHAFAAIALPLILAACSTDSMMTPKADVPGSQQTTQTVAPKGDTQSDDKQDVDYNTTRKPMIDSEPEQVTQGNPQNSLQAQAQALEAGEENPSETKVKREGNLGANLYKNDTQTTQVASLYSAQATKGSIRFLPIIGAPVQAVTPLSKELGNSARGNGLTIKGSADETAEHVLKGYLSAFSDGGKVTVVYVWDVLDNAGGRLHRIQGQQSVNAEGGGDAWSAVPPSMMQSIGVQTIDEYLKWKQSQG